MISMTKDEAIDREAEWKLFKAQMIRDHGSHVFKRDALGETDNMAWQDAFDGWLAAKRSIAQPTSEAVATVLYWQTERSAGWEFNWLGKPPVAGTEIDLFAAPVPVAQQAADTAPVPAQTGTIGDDAEFMRLLTGLNHLTRNADTDARWEAAAERQRELIAHIDARLNSATTETPCKKN